MFVTEGELYITWRNLQPRETER